MVQLKLAIEAVFGSWNNPRAVLYRKKNKIADDLGTAVNVQCMVFGNKGNTSATGVAFTRNPANGQKEFYGDYLVNAQGEDVTGKLDIEKQTGAIKIAPAEYHVVTEGAFKVYDGTALTAPGNIVGLVNGEEASLSVTGSQTDAAPARTHTPSRSTSPRRKATTSTAPIPSGRWR